MFHLPFHIPKSAQNIQHNDPVMLIGSCFTEHIGNRMEDGKMNVCINPNGILFNPSSIAQSLQFYLDRKNYSTEDIFQLNETWNSWDFHSRFSHTDKDIALAQMNQSVAMASSFLKDAKWILITFGSAYQYFTQQHSGAAGYYGVANCHKAPGQWFEKRLLDTKMMQEQWAKVLQALKIHSPGLRIIFTVSPVRHTRDGLTENNRSKARLIELAHSLVEQFDHCSYFPAYEIVIDVLRDYRFYEQDMTHPNSQAAQYVWEQFVDTFMEKETMELLQNIKEITTAMQHRPRFTHTEHHAKFKASFLARVKALSEKYPHLNLEKEMHYFEQSRH